MHTILQPLLIALLFVLVRSADLAITAGVARDYLRALAYGIVALLALIVMILSVLV